jgi:hypothetical protein
MPELDGGPVFAIQPDRQGHAIALLGRKGRRQVQSRTLALGSGLLGAVVVFRLVAVVVTLALLGRRIGIADRCPASRLRLRQERQNRLERVALAVRAQRETHVPLVAPVETALGVAEQRVGGLQEAEAGEHLAGVEEIDGDRVRGHRSLLRRCVRASLIARRDAIRCAGVLASIVPA